MTGTEKAKLHLLVYDLDQLGRARPKLRAHNATQDSKYTSTPDVAQVSFNRKLG